MIPLLVALGGRRVVVIGAGAVGLSRARQLVDAGASVTIVASELRGELPDGIAAFEHRAFRDRDLDGAWLVVSATGDRAVDDRIAKSAGSRRIWCNVVDDAERSDVYFPAVHREGSVVIAVSTGGSSPSLAIWLRDLIRSTLPTGLAGVAEILGRERAALRERGRVVDRGVWRDRVEELLRSARADGSASTPA